MRGKRYLHGVGSNRQNIPEWVTSPTATFIKNTRKGLWVTWMRNLPRASEVQGHFTHQIKGMNMTLKPFENLCTQQYTWKDKIMFKLFGIKLTRDAHSIVNFKECYYYKGKYYVTKE